MNLITDLPPKQTLGYGIHGAGISAFVLALALHSQRAFDSGLRVVVAAAGLMGGLMAAAQVSHHELSRVITSYYESKPSPVFLT